MASSSCRGPVRDVDVSRRLTPRELQQQGGPAIDGDLAGVNTVVHDADAQKQRARHHAMAQHLEDGALHAEKYFYTVWDDFHATRPSARWRHLMALSRVTASEFGKSAEGQEEARQLLGLS